MAIDELGKAAVVIDGSGSASASHKEFKPGDAERVLNIHQEQADSKPVVSRWRDMVLIGPSFCIRGPFLVWNPPDISHLLRIIVTRKR
jgi:hypothetical protein